MRFLRDLWDEGIARGLGDGLDYLRYRSNLLGTDLRITNFGGGNTSSKLLMNDPFTGAPVRVLAVKGSGGDLGGIRREGFALLYLDRLEQLIARYRGEQFEDEMVACYGMCTFGESRAPASIDTPLHAFLPFDHIDHLHPDWAIALAASANGRQKLAEFNERYGHKLAWIPWRRPGFELGLILRRTVQESPECDGIVLGSHGLFTWGRTDRECYSNSIGIIDQLGEFVAEHERRAGVTLFGGVAYPASDRRADVAAAIFPHLRGQLATVRRYIGYYDGSQEMLDFVNALDARELARLGTSCPDHFIRTRIRPMYVDWNAGSESFDLLRDKVTRAAEEYRRDYAEYYERCKDPGSPPLRDANPSVVLIAGLGMFTFGKTRTEARITAEFYINAKQVMAGAVALGDGEPAPAELPQARDPSQSRRFTSFRNYVALPLEEAFRIEYWALEEAKLKRMPPEQELSRRIYFVAGAGSGIGRATVFRLLAGGAHVMIADLNLSATEETAELARRYAPPEAIAWCQMDVRDRGSVATALRCTCLQFGGLDGVINTAAVYIAPDLSGTVPDAQWRETFDSNITGSFLLADEAAKIFREQGLPACAVLTSSANAVVPKRGSLAYDVSKGAVSHLVRELAVGLAPLVRVNGIAPAAVIEGSQLFGRDRLLTSLAQYEIEHEPGAPTEALRNKLAQFYAQRTLTGLPVTPEDCANAIYWLASDNSAKTTGHIVPVDGGLPGAFLR